MVGEPFHTTTIACIETNFKKIQVRPMTTKSKTKKTSRARKVDLRKSRQSLAGFVCSYIIYLLIYFFIIGRETII